MELSDVLDFPLKVATGDRCLARRWVPVLGRKFHATDDVHVRRGWQRLHRVWQELETTMKEDPALQSN
eukprot:3127978-Pyramimonas_sp.AAC.1